MFSVKQPMEGLVKGLLIILMLSATVSMGLWGAELPKPRAAGVSVDPNPAPFLQVNVEKQVRLHDIVYRQPAIRPTDYLPLGNGDLGFMVDPLGSMTLGGWVAKSDMFLKMSAGPMSGLHSLKDLQMAWVEGGQEAVNGIIADEKANGDYRQSRVRPRVAGQVRSELWVNGQLLSNAEEILKDYEQRLNIYDGWVATKFRWPGHVETQATAFAHSGKNVLVFRYQDKAEKGKKVCRRISLARAVWELYKVSKGFCCGIQGKEVKGREWFTVSADKSRQAILLEYANKGGLKLTMALRAVGGKVRLVVDPSKEPDATFPYDLPKSAHLLNPLPMRAGNAYFETESASVLDVTVLTAVVTSQDSPDPTRAALQLLDEATAFPHLQQTHAAWWHSFWKRSFVEIADKDLENYWYHQNYQMAAVSRGKFPPSICQLWVAMPEYLGGGGYWSMNHAQMYTGVQVTNHPELGEPLWRLLQQSLPGFRETARKRYEARGIAIDNQFGPDGINLSVTPYGYQYYGSALMGLLQYWRFLYSMDRGLLAREIYPFLKEAVQFYQDLMVWDDLKQQYNMPLPSCSINECIGFTGLNDPFDLATVRRLLLNTIEASEILGVDTDLRRKWKDFESKIAPFPENGKQYVLYEGAKPPGHRVDVTTLCLAYPTGMVDTAKDPLWPATLGDVAAFGMGVQAFTGMWWATAAAWTRAGDTVSTALHAELRRHLFPNGLIGESELIFVPEYGRPVPTWVLGESGPWAQSAINEGLCRSLYDGVIRVFTAPPSYYRDRETPARFAGLRAVNGFVVSAEQERGGRVRFIAIQSLAGANCSVELPQWKPEDLVVEEVDAKSGDALRRVSVSLQDSIAVFATTIDKVYLLYPRGKRPGMIWEADWNKPVTPRFAYVGLPERAVASR